MICLTIIVTCINGCHQRQGKSPQPTEPKQSQPLQTEVPILVPPEEGYNQFFNEEDICVQLLNSKNSIHAQTTSSSMYVDGENVYITFFVENKLYCHSSNDKKVFFADEAWNCFKKGGVMYYETWGGSTSSPRNLAMRAVGETKILVEDCDFTYGKTAIYYEKITYHELNYKKELHCMEYGTHKSEFIMELDEKQYFSAEYAGKLWCKGKDGLYESELDGSKMKLRIPKCTEVVGYRNAYIYYLENGNSFKRYSIQTGEIAVLPDIFNKSTYTYNFTDQYFLIANENGLFAYEADFTSNKMLSDKRVYAIYSVDNVIILNYDNSSTDGGYIQIDEVGSIIRTFK